MRESAKNQNQPNGFSPDELKETFRKYMEDFGLTNTDLRKPLLDVGTGSGKFVRHIRDVIHNKSAFGVELYPSRVPNHIEGIVAADGSHLPFRDSSFANVLGRNYVPMLYETSNSTEAVQEMIRVATQDGKVKFNTSSPNQEREDNSEIGLKRHAAAVQLFDYLEELENQGFFVQRHQRREDDRWIITITKPNLR